MAQPFEWQWNYKILLFTAVFLPLTISLGFWQLNRAEYKQQLLNEQRAKRQAPTVAFEQIEVAEQYLNIHIIGERYQPAPTLLLDNRVRSGRPGYEVLDIVKTPTGDLLLVNRGWLEGSRDRQVLPEVEALASPVQLTGYLYRTPGKQLMLGEDPWNPQGTLEVIQNADPQHVATRLNNELYPYVLRLDNTSNGAFDASWVTVNIQPEKHQGYAVQWFLMAMALVVLTLFANSNLAQLLKKQDGNN